MKEWNEESARIAEKVTMKSFILLYEAVSSFIHKITGDHVIVEDGGDNKMGKRGIEKKKGPKSNISQRETKETPNLSQSCIFL